MSKELRKTVRRDAHYGVWIAYGSDRILVPCTLNDISDAGARLALPGNGDVPDRFMLLLSERGRAYRRCQVAWRTSEEVGVRFIMDPSASLTLGRT